MARGHKLIVIAPVVVAAAWLTYFLAGYSRSPGSGYVSPIAGLYGEDAVGRALLDGRDYDRALVAYCGDPRRMSVELLQRIHRAGIWSAGALDLCDAFLQYFPFGETRWLDQRDEYAEVVARRVRLLGNLGAQVDPAGQQDIAAAALGLDLGTLRVGQQPARSEFVEKLEAAAPDIVARFPASHLAPLAVAQCAESAKHRIAKHSTAGGSPRDFGQLDEYLRSLITARAPGRTLVLVKLALAECAGDDSARARDLFEQVARETGLKWERRELLLRAALCAHEVGRADDARALLEQSMGILRECQASSAANIDFSSPLLDTAVACSRLEDDRSALALLAEIDRQYAWGECAPLAHLAMADIFEKARAEQKMIQALRKAAAAPAVNTFADVLDASNTRSRATERLGLYYIRSGEWSLALDCWKRWQPTSWCSTCEKSMMSERSRFIRTCRWRLCVRWATDHPVWIFTTMVIVAAAVLFGWPRSRPAP
ncbi:MAG: hypothetical protein AB1714_01380 [Acidobacteriota bacterium]